MDRLQSMRVFQQVVDDGSFAAAARTLDISPAAVTRLVADLEEHLGTRLLQRSTRRLSLTQAGETYLGKVRSILQDIDEAHAATSSDTVDLSGVLRLQAPPVLASYAIAPLIAGFRERYPKILIDLDVWSPKDPPIEDYDLTLLSAADDFDANIIARKIIDSQAILVATPAYLAKRGTPISLEELATHECLRLKPFGERPKAWRMWCEMDKETMVDLDVHSVLWANHTDTLLRAALEGAGITSMPVDLAAAYLTRGELVRVLYPWITGRFSMYAALPSRKYIPQRTRVFMDYLIEFARKRATELVQNCVGCQDESLIQLPVLMPE